MEDIDYIGNLIKAHKYLLKKFKLEKQEFPPAESFYFDKYTKASAENLELKDKISKLELQIFNLNKELDNRRLQIQKLSK